MRLLEPGLLAFPDQPFILEPRPDRAVKEAHVVLRLEGALQTLDGPQRERVAERARLLHGEGNELTAYRRGVCGRPPRTGRIVERRDTPALKRRTQLGPTSSRVKPTRWAAAPAARVGSSSSRRMMRARWATAAGSVREAARRRTASASSRLTDRNTTRAGMVSLRWRIPAPVRMLHTRVGERTTQFAA